jgi:hypothetical protein
MKLRFALTAVALAAVQVGLGLPAMAQPAAQTDAAAHKAAADRLAAIVVSDSDVPMMVEGMLDAAIAQMLNEEPEMAQFDEEFPGLFEALKNAWRPVLLKDAYDSRPPYRADLSALYQANLTTDEIKQAADFLGQPDVQGYLKAAKKKIDYRATLGDAMADREIQQGSIRSDVARAGSAAAEEASPQMRRKLSDFFNSPVGRKLVALNPKKMVIDAKWVNYSPPGGEEEIERITLEAMLGHIAKTDPALAAQMRKELEAGEAAGKKSN